MKRGTIVIVILLAVALSAAGFTVWYHYQNQRRALEFWGAATAQLIGRAGQIEVVELGEPDPSIALADDALDAPEPEESPAAPPRAKALEFNEVPWIVVQTKDAAKAKGILNLRRALVVDATFDWSVEDEGEPHWQYAISVNDGRNWATVLFDLDSRQVGLTGGRKTVLLAPEANEDFRQFFAEQFPAEAKDSRQHRQDEQDATKKRETSSRQDEQE